MCDTNCTYTMYYYHKKCEVRAKVNRGEVIDTTIDRSEKCPNRH